MRGVAGALAAVLDGTRVAPSFRMTPTGELREGMAQVREILIGAIQRDLERRIVKLEVHLAARTGELAQEVRRRIDIIESHFRTEIEALAARVDADIVELRDGSRALAREQRESSAASDQRVGRVEEALARAQRDIRSQILDQVKSFVDELHQVRAEVAETLERELGSVEPEGVEEPREQREDDESPTAH